MREIVLVTLTTDHTGFAERGYVYDGSNAISNRRTIEITYNEIFFGNC